MTMSAAFRGAGCYVAWRAKREFSVGLLFIAGFKYFFTPNWAVELELG